MCIHTYIPELHSAYPCTSLCRPGHGWLRFYWPSFVRFLSYFRSELGWVHCVLGLRRLGLINIWFCSEWIFFMFQCSRHFVDQIIFCPIAFPAGSPLFEQLCIKRVTCRFTICWNGAHCHRTMVTQQQQEVITVPCELVSLFYVFVWQNM